MTNIGVNFPVQAMQIEASIWTAPWASPGGQAPNWGQGPFRAYFQGFDIDGCIAQNNTIPTTACSGFASKFWWNRKNFWKLNPNQIKAYLDVRKKYLVYDYCIHRPGPKAPECKKKR